MKMEAQKLVGFYCVLFGAFLLESYCVPAPETDLDDLNLQIIPNEVKNDTNLIQNSTIDSNVTETGNSTGKVS